MRREELKRFCIAENGWTSFDIGDPFELGDFTYATNGHIAIRTPRIDDGISSDGRKIPNIEKIFSDAIEPEEYIPVPDPGPIIVEVCDECWEGPDCECEGTGLIEPLSYLKVGKQCFQRKYLRLLRTLPDVEIGTTDGMNPARFRFSGGDGVIMPIDPKGQYMQLQVIMRRRKR